MTSKIQTRKILTNKKNAIDEFHVLFHTIAELSANEALISTQNIW